MHREKEEKRAGWSFINLFPFVPSEPAGIQRFSLSRLPSPNSVPLSLFLSLSDVIVSCPVDADTQLQGFIHKIQTLCIRVAYRCADVDH